MISVTRSAGTGTIQPLDRVLIRSERPGTVVVLDGCSKEYFRSKTAHEAEVIVSGALGLHTARLLDDAGKEIASVVFRVECFTSVEDKGGQFETLLTQLHYTMGRRGFGSCLFGGRVYNYFVHWVRDHVHTLKGMKYFCEAFRNGMELYRDSQREDGMIFDLVEPRVTDRDESEERFEYGGFVRPVENRRLHFKRIPVENDVEFLYVEGSTSPGRLQVTTAGWKACSTAPSGHSVLPDQSPAVVRKQAAQARVYNRHGTSSAMRTPR